MTDPITGLMRLGLTEYEARAYVAVVCIGEGGIGDISQESGIPRARVYDIMERLAGKGFVEIGGSKPLRYRANDPKRVAQGVLTELENTVDDIVLQLHNKKKKTLKSLNPVWIIPDERGIDINLKELIASSSHQITVVALTTSPFLKYAPLFSDISNRLKVTAVISHQTEGLQRLLGATEILKPSKSSSFLKASSHIFTFRSQIGERTFTFELIVISDSGSLVVYREDDERMAMGMDASTIFDLFLRLSVKDAIRNSKPI